MDQPASEPTDPIGAGYMPGFSNHVVTEVVHGTLADWSQLA